MYCFNDDQVTFRYIDLKALYNFLRIPEIPNEYSNFRPKSLGEMF